MHDTLSHLWYYILALVWAVYVSQEFFISGSAMMSQFYKVNSKEFKEINESVGTHWDGVQVWLIVAIGGLFAVFYNAYALIFEVLYIPVFLLLFMIIFRGLAIELIYKSEDPKWQKCLQRIWAVSSFGLILVVGVYLTNLFIGLPIENGKLTTSFLTIFNLVGIIGGLLFVTSALTLGSIWIKIACNKTYLQAQKPFINFVAVANVFLLILLLIAFNHKTSGFSEGLFLDYKIIWALPIGCLLTAIIATILNLKANYKMAFVMYILTAILLIFTGFSMTFPYIVYSTVAVEQGLLIIDASAKEYTLTLITISAGIFVPIVIGYQTWKYIRFWKR